MTYIKAGYGVEVGQNFARLAKDTPIQLSPDEHAMPRHVIGYIDEQKESTLGFMRIGNKGKIRVHVLKDALAEGEA